MPFSEKMHTIQDFERLYDQYFDQIYRFIYFKVPSKEEAQDITSEVFCQLYRYFLKKKSIKHIKSFLYTLARNRVTDYYRLQSNKFMALDPEMQISDVSKGNGLHEQVSISHEVKQIKEHIKSLPKQYQDIIILRYIEGYDISETAKILKKSQGSIRVASHRALKALESCLKESSNN